MNQLQLVQRLQLECGVSGTVTTAQNQIGSIGRLVTWINQAWDDIQTEHDDWIWMRSSALLGGGCSFVPPAGNPVNPLGTGAGTCGIPMSSFGKWEKNSFRCYTTSAGYINETFLDKIPFDTWRNAYMLGAMRNVQTRPVAIAFGPDESICLGPPPNGLYTIYGDYYVAPSAMVADTDVPALLPAQFHMIIVNKAMMKYGGYEAAPEVFQRGNQEYQLALDQLEALKVPQMSFAGALA